MLGKSLIANGARFLYYWLVFMGEEWLNFFLTLLSTHVHHWTWLSWRGKGKLPNEHPIGTLCEAIDSHRTLSLSFSTAWCDQAWVSRSGVRIPIKAIFRFFSSPNFLQQSINGEYFLNNSFDWLIRVAIGVTSQKMALTGIRTPDLETWNLTWNWNWHSMLNCSTRSKHVVKPGWGGKAPIPSHRVPMGVEVYVRTKTDTYR